MPHYFFHIRHLTFERDEVGLDLADDGAAFSEATRACGEMIAELDGALSVGPEWCMDVADNAGVTIYVLRFSVQLGAER